MHRRDCRRVRRWRAAGAESGRRRTTGQTVPGTIERNDLEVAGCKLRHPDRGLVRLGAGAQRQHLRQGIREDIRKGLSELDNGVGKKAAVNMIEPRDGFADGGGNLGMPMPEDCAHLSRREVENFAPVRVAYVNAAGTFDDAIREFTAIAEDVMISWQGHVLGRAVNWQHSLHTKTGR